MDRKRPRAEESSSGADNRTELLEDDQQSPSRQTPAYGSRPYWEERYQKFAKVDEEQKEASTTTTTTTTEAEATSTGTAQPDAQHAWYFTYEELGPLLLPLILGDDNDDEQEEQDAEEHEEQESDTDGNEDNEKAEEDDDFHCLQSARSGDTIEAFVEEIDEEEEEEETPTRIGLAKERPISVIEIGCGDVPLGRDLAKGISELPPGMGGVTARPILKRVVCTDYSEAVIEAMKTEHRKSEEAKEKVDCNGKERGDGDNDDDDDKVELEYVVADARRLPYPDESFELVLEKGTLDAMLSDKNEGTTNCISIVAECARILSIGGAMLIVSHLNAHAESGINWLNNVVVKGLRKGCSKCEWEVEVHGKEEDNDDEGAEENKSDGPGPAVYIIHKKPPKKGAKENEEEDSPTIPLRFLSY
jgi:hypothetical protein